VKNPPKIATRSIFYQNYFITFTVEQKFAEICVTSVIWKIRPEVDHPKSENSPNLVILQHSTISRRQKLLFFKYKHAWSRPCDHELQDQRCKNYTAANSIARFYNINYFYVQQNALAYYCKRDMDSILLKSDTIPQLTSEAKRDIEGFYL
jgi:hypothetical protein